MPAMRIAALAVSCVVLTAAPSANAQETSDPHDTTAQETTAVVRFDLKKHPSMRVGSALKLDLTARVDSDTRLATPAIGMESADFQFAHRRVGVEGSLYKKVEFEISRDLGSDGVWRDVFVNVRQTKTFEVQAGRFKIPFGRETLTGSKNLDFVRRSLIATELGPSRDTGVMAHGRLFHRHLEYASGYFAGDGDNSRTSKTEGGGKTAAARLVFLPLSDSSGKASKADDALQLGFAVTTSSLTNVLGLRGRTVFSDGVFFDRGYVNGTRQRYGLEAAWARGPVSITSEYITVSDDRSGMGFSGEDLDPVHARGWYLSATWALTGEKKAGRLEPRRTVGHGFGAVELAARIEQLRFGNAGSNPSTNADRAMTTGLNWYLNYYVRVQSNLVIESIEDPQRSPAPSTAGRFIGAVFRVQFTL
jgi:phosphate-selective porin OprO/OprP